MTVILVFDCAKNRITLRLYFDFWISLKEKPISRGRGQRRKVEICLQTIGDMNDRPEIKPVTGQFDNVPDENEVPKKDSENEIESADSLPPSQERSYYSTHNYFCIS